MSNAENEPLDANTSALEPDPRLFIGGIAKGMAVLGTVARANGPLSLGEIAARSAIGRSAAQRVVYTLTALGYLTRDDRTRRYLLAARMLDFTCGYLRSSPLAARAFPYLLEAHRRTNETVNLTERDGTDVIYVSRLPGRDVISADLVIGSRLPAYCTAPGRAILAAMPEPVARQLVVRAIGAPLTPYTVTDADAVMERVATARRHGFALASQECFVGDISVAAAVVPPGRGVVGAVNIAVSASIWTEAEVLARLAPTVIETAAAIARVHGDA